ncbi:putative uncharacterized protein BRD3OS [Hippoglossus hippoglossus]|uniref:putative uncharacterized protein BRD3OS n=1 Tax=Hippoglossus hippoglossus TaxID=8267 RepID=UPI00148E420B|nr:putative uncharacterized protein BRD3OS [Hippoglossus hippoglossus]XP_034451502.1 putative uncharacterized protein BRD3OS [Hippoglossus hippoglossus]XP_035021288.1 putative uncharacterized protein BRD3OS [Hippoglossus stenolepis]
MSAFDPPAVGEPGPDSSASPGSPGSPGRPLLAEKALSESFSRLRYRDTSLMIWQQQQLEMAPPSTYLSRSQSTWYSSYGNQAVLVRDKRGLEDGEGRSRICSIM